MTLFPLKVGARSSPLSQRQTVELLEELKIVEPQASFSPIFIETSGDQDLKTSLRTLDKTDFFTKEIDKLLLSKEVSIGIHSAKDLPEPLPKGLTVVALTRGVDPSDSLVLREGETLESLPKEALIATSSLRREDNVRRLRDDLKFRDLRGTIQKRLTLLDSREADGIVVAEAALVRLGLTHLNRLRIPGETAAFQGQLAVVAREDDLEMKALFYPLDVRHLPRALYPGPEWPLQAFRDRWIHFAPLLKIQTRKANDPAIKAAFQAWPRYTHLIVTSKSAVKSLFSLIKVFQLPLSEKHWIAVGNATAAELFQYGIKTPEIAADESSEGIVKLLQKLELNKAHLFWPHSALSRPVITEYGKRNKILITDCAVYDIQPDDRMELPDLNIFEEVLFSSPSTVKAFFDRVHEPPSHLKLTPIGPVTAEALRLAFACQI